MTEVHSEVSAIAAPDVRIKSNMLARAKQGDREAIATMFRQFVPEDEQIYGVEYLGVQGLWLGTHSFACVTNRRIASIRVKLFGAVNYQDGSLEYVNSTVVHQPSLLLLYLWVIGVSILTLGVGLLLLPLTVRLFYRFKKSGLVLCVREGLSLYIFTDRKLLLTASGLYQMAATLREGRLAEIGQAFGRPQVARTPAVIAATMMPRAAREERKPIGSDSLLLASSLLALGGAILVFLGTLLPIVGGGSDVKLIGTDAENWFALQPIVGAVTLAGIAVLLLARSSKRLLTSGLLIGTGVQCLLFYFSYLAFYGRVDGLSPGIGVYLGLAGGALVVASGLSRLPSD
jgi:hypothetical protein